MNAVTPPAKLGPKDYASDQEVRWCPGCGDYAILKAVQRTLTDLQAAPEQTVFVSGIGCAARFPYYLSTYGFHTIHGRAPAIATGLKLANPDLDVWVVSGDGDGLSIGGNHLLHLLRRDIDLQFLLFNNEIYGLTKGQASPTSRLGTRSPSSPAGTQDTPLSATKVALAAGARFVARAVDTDKALPTLLKQAKQHRGTSFVEILQNCIVYNDNVFSAVTDRAVAADAQVQAVDGEPLVFGRDRDKGLVLDTARLSLKVIDFNEPSADESQVLIHDSGNAVLASLLAAMEGPDFPVAMGVLYQAPAVESPDQDTARRSIGEVSRAEINALLRQGHTWRHSD